MATHYLEFEKPIAELDAKIAELSLLAPTSGSFETEIAALRNAFGDDHGLVVETAPGAGTKVIVRVPKFAPGVHS